MLIKLTILICLLIAPRVYASTELQAHIKNVSGISMSRAAQLAGMFSRSCKKYGVECEILVGIAAKESMFKVDAYNAKSQDYWIMQINIHTAKAMQLDIGRLLTDAQYNIDAGAKVLAYMKRRFAAKEIAWYCRYNVGTGALTSRRAKLCKSYAAAVLRYNSKDVAAE